MPRYRCYLMTGEHIRAVQNFECDNDAEVILKAAALLQSQPQHQKLEVWQDKRLVAHIPRSEQKHSKLKIVPKGP
jgi:hypothetical protein